MSRRGQFIFIPALSVLVVGLVIYFFFVRTEKKTYYPAAMALPESSVMLYQGTQLQKAYSAFSANDFYKYLLHNGSVSHFHRSFLHYDSLFSRTEGFRKLLAKNPLIASVHATDGEQLDLLLLLQTEDMYDAKDFFKVLKEVQYGITMTERNFDGNRVFDLKDQRHKSVLSFCLIDGILALSENAVLVEDAVTSYSQHKSTNNPFIEKLIENTRKEKIFVNFRQLPKVFTPYASSDYREGTERLSETGSFGFYDWKTSNSEISLSGTMKGSKEVNCYFDLLLDSKPQKLDLAKVLPSRTAVYSDFGVSDFAGYYEAFTKFRKQGKNSEELVASIDKFETGKEVSLKNEILPLFGNEWGFVSLEPGTETDSLYNILVVKQKGDSTPDTLRKLNLRMMGKAGMKYAGINYRNYSLENSAFGNMTSLVFGSDAEGIKDPWFASVGNYLVFANKMDDVKRFIDAFLDEQTLSSSPNYKKFIANFGAESNFMFYMNPSRTLPAAQQFVKENYSEKYLDNISLLKGIDGFGFQLSSNGADFYNRILMTRLPSKEESTEMLWSVQLQADPVGKPYIISGKADNVKNIFITDEKYNAYLVSPSGGILWKKQLDGPIVGELQQMDLYENGSTQILFATKTSLYLMDKEGKNVGNYPLRLGAKPTSGVALFRFNNSGKYQFFVGTQNNRVYGYSGDGKPLTGWNPQIVDAPLVLPLKYFKIRNEAYLFGVTNRGTVYIWNTKGERSAKPVEVKNRFRNPFRITTGVTPEECSFTAPDTNGIMYKVMGGGEIIKRDYKAGRNPFFDFVDADGDGDYEYMMSWKNHIHIYEPGGKLKYKIKAMEDVLYPPQVFKINNRTYIGYVAGYTNQIFLVSPANTVFKSFPLSGQTPFVIEDINNDNSPDLVVGGAGKRLFMYKLSK